MARWIKPRLYLEVDEEFTMENGTCIKCIKDNNDVKLNCENCIFDGYTSSSISCVDILCGNDHRPDETNTHFIEV